MEKVMPDLILLDIEMPDMDGLEALKLLKENIKFKNIPVIFLTGLTDPATEAYGIELGAVDFVTKPFSEPVLLNRIKYHMHIGEIIREHTAELSERTAQLENIQNGLLQTLTNVVNVLTESSCTQSDPGVSKIFNGIKNQLEDAKSKMTDI
jgi:putative two-component system response regulator